MVLSGIFIFFSTHFVHLGFVPSIVLAKDGYFLFAFELHIIILITIDFRLWKPEVTGSYMLFK